MTNDVDTAWSDRSHASPLEDVQMAASRVLNGPQGIDFDHEERQRVALCIAQVERWIEGKQFERVNWVLDERVIDYPMQALAAALVDVCRPHQSVLPAYTAFETKLRRVLAAAAENPT